MMGVLLACDEECGSKAILVLTLTFMRVLLFSVHGEVVDCKQRVIGIWASMLFLTSINNLNAITKRNLMACAVGAVFAAYRADVVNMSAIFEEPAEHMFAGMRNFFKMFTIADIPILDEKVQRRMSSLVEYGITSQASDRSGGYAAGTVAYMQRNARMILQQKETLQNKRQPTEVIPPLQQHRSSNKAHCGGIQIDPSRSVAAQIAIELLPILSAVSRGMRCTMSRLGFEEDKLCGFMDPFAEFIDVYNIAMTNSRGAFHGHDEESRSSSGTSSASVNVECLADLFDNFLSLNVNEEEETIAARTEATDATPLINEYDSSPPAMDVFLNACLDVHNIPSIHHQGNDAVTLKWQLAVTGMQACEVSTLGFRERGHVDMEMHFKQLNMRWSGTAQGSNAMADIPLVDSLKRNVLFQINNNVYRVLTVYSKTYNKWLEIESVPMSHLQRSANLYKVHARRLVEDVLSFSCIGRKFSSAADCIELLTTGHAIAAGTIIGSL